MTDTTSDDAKQRTRRTIAFVMIGLSMLGIASVAGLAIGFASSGDRGDTTTLVFTSMLPLFGTWVGTVLAFYFTADNLEAATRSTLSTLRLTGTLDDHAPVADVMIRPSAMSKVQLQGNETVAAIKLHDLYAQMQTDGYHRIPILGRSGEALHVIHDSIINRFASSKSKDPSDATVFTETMQDLLAEPELETLVQALAFVDDDAIIGAARAAMTAVPHANDVFVTATGQRSEPVVGWLTNTQLAGLD